MKASCTTKHSLLAQETVTRGAAEGCVDETEYITSWWLDCSLQDK